MFFRENRTPLSFVTFLYQPDSSRPAYSFHPVRHNSLSVDQMLHGDVSIPLKCFWGKKRLEEGTSKWSFMVIVYMLCPVSAWPLWTALTLAGLGTAVFLSAHFLLFTFVIPARWDPTKFVFTAHILPSFLLIFSLFSVVYLSPYQVAMLLKTTSQSFLATQMH